MKPIACQYIVAKLEEAIIKTNKEDAVYKIYNINWKGGLKLEQIQHHADQFVESYQYKNATLAKNAEKQRIKERKRKIRKDYQVYSYAEHLYNNKCPLSKAVKVIQSHFAESNIPFSNISKIVNNYYNSKLTL